MSKQYAPLAAQIIEAVGGPANIRSAFHCQTRLRFDLRDESKADRAALAANDGVTTALSSGGMFQVVVGMHVKDVFDEVEAQLGRAGTTDAAGDGAPKEKRGVLNTVIDFISGTFLPIIPALAGAGMVRAVLSLLVVFGWITRESQTYIALNFMADAVFYFMPVLLAISAALKLKANPYLAASVAAMMLHPTWVGLVTAGKPVLLFDVIPLTLTNYSYSVIPVMLVILVQSVVERWLNKWMPKSVNMVFVPLLTFLVMGILAFSVVGPIGAFLGGYLAAFFTFLSTTAAWASPTLIGALWPIMVMFGVHTAVGPLGFAQINAMKFDSIVGPGIIVSNIAQGVAGLTVAFRTRDPRLKQIATAGGITGLMGITEPVLYGVNLPKRYPLIAACIGGAAGGLFAGLTHTRRFAAGVSGLPALPMYIGEDTLQYLYNILIALGISTVVTVVVTIALSFHFEKVVHPSVDTEVDHSVDDLAAVTASAGGVATLTRADVTELSAPCTGEAVPLDTVSDPVFASLAMGPGVGVIPASGEIVAPCSGTVMVAMDSGHAFGIRTDDGVEVLVHVGIDTVKLKGVGFTNPVAVGTRVEAGQHLVTADLTAIKAAGYDTAVVVAVTNHTKLGDVTPFGVGPVVVGEPVLAVAAR
ncbi:MAG: beta-glucoside-specific PTS transporter subunit IIABC [Actinobacteria bacterium]|nr:beta-glucoside-specific PTS transporter subunit IIABC [Actinomycetota bacterium]